MQNTADPPTGSCRQHAAVAGFEIHLGTVTKHATATIDDFDIAGDSCEFGSGVISRGITGGLAAGGAGHLHIPFGVDGCQAAIRGEIGISPLNRLNNIQNMSRTYKACLEIF